MPPPTPEATHQPPPEPTCLPLLSEYTPCARLSLPTLLVTPHPTVFHPLSFPFSLSVSLCFSLYVSPPCSRLYCFSSSSPTLLSPADVRCLRNLSCTWLCEALDTACNIYDSRLHRNLDFAADTLSPVCRTAGISKISLVISLPCLTCVQTDFFLRLIFSLPFFALLSCAFFMLRYRGRSPRLVCVKRLTF